MNKFILLFSITILSLPALGQRDTLNMTFQGYLPQPKDSVLEALVKMAWENPRIGFAENTAGQAEYLYKRDRTAWMNNLTVSGNLNEYSIKGNTINDQFRGNFFPRYNIGLQIPLGLFVNNKKVSAASQYRYQATLDQISVEQQMIRRELTILYEQHLMTRELMLLQEEIIDDAKIVYTRNEQRFEAGEITLDIYSTSLRVYNAEKVKQVNYAFIIAQLEAQLEELIGMNYTDALQQISIQLRSRR